METLLVLLKLALSSAEQKLVTAQKENDLLVAQILDMKERDVVVSSPFFISLCLNQMI